MKNTYVDEEQSGAADIGFKAEYNRPRRARSRL